MCYFFKAYSADNNEIFVRLENGAEFLLTSAFVFTSDTERHFHFRAVGRGFEDV